MAGAPTLARILRHHLGPDLLAGADLMPAALAAPGYTGADAEAAVRRAKGAARRAQRTLELGDLVREVRAGYEPMTPETRHRVAVHEVGHALVSRLLGVGSIVGVSIHVAGGSTELTGSIQGSATLQHLEDGLAMLLGGRAAEMLVLGDASIGAGGFPGSDIGQATRLALSIEAEYGLGSLGNVYVGPETDVLAAPGLSGAVKRRLDAAAERARALLAARRRALERAGRELERKGYLSAEELDHLLHEDEKPQRPAEATGDSP